MPGLEGSFSVSELISKCTVRREPRSPDTAGVGGLIGTDFFATLEEEEVVGPSKANTEELGGAELEEAKPLMLVDGELVE